MGFKIVYPRQFLIVFEVKFGKMETFCSFIPLDAQWYIPSNKKCKNCFTILSWDLSRNLGEKVDKKLSYHRGTVQCAMLVNLCHLSRDMGAIKV